MCGVAGSGKSTVTKDLEKDTEDAIRLSSDELRAKFGKGEEDQSVSSRVFSEMFKQTEILLNSGFNVIIDATNTTPRSRKDFVNIARKLNKKIFAYVFDVPLDELKRRNQKRKEAGGRFVPEDIVEKQFNKFTPPQKPEVDEIHVIK